jgi:hypothetical protein
MIEKSVEEHRGNFSPSPVHRLIWGYFSNSAVNLVDAIMGSKVIPPASAKALELTARLFLATKRSPNDIVKWYEKNLPKLNLLLDAAEKWDFLGEGGTDQKFQLGPFTVYNTINLTGNKLNATRDIIEKASNLIRRSPVPGFEQVLYGDIYIVGRLKKPTVLAWYNITDDIVYLRPHVKVGMGEVHNFIHEFAHRYWMKFVSSSQQSNWETSSAHGDNPVQDGTASRWISSSRPGSRDERDPHDSGVRRKQSTPRYGRLCGCLLLVADHGGEYTETPVSDFVCRDQPRGTLL